MSDANDELTKISHKATGLFMTDPEFHARTCIAIVWTQKICERNDVPFDQASALQAACLALTIADASLADLFENPENQAELMASLLQANLAHENASRAARERADEE